VRGIGANWGSKGPRPLAEVSGAEPLTFSISVIALRFSNLPHREHLNS
jgi:hypothetical protein